MSPLPPTIGFTVRPDFLTKASVRMRRIPLSCVVVVVRMISSFELIGCAITGAARLAKAERNVIARKRAKRLMRQAPAYSCPKGQWRYILSCARNHRAGQRSRFTSSPRRNEHSVTKSRRKERVVDCRGHVNGRDVQCEFRRKWVRPNQ